MHKMMLRTLLVGWGWGLSVAPVLAGPIAIDYLSAFIAVPQLNSNALEDTRIGFGFNEFEAAGLAVAFTDQLDADHYGSVTWTVTNATGQDLVDVRFFGFLDAEIDELTTSAFNEYGTLRRVDGAGASDPDPDYWEIDEPGFSFGDIYTNLLAGALDNANAVPAGAAWDVSLALGFQVGDLLADQRLVATFEISDQDIGGLSHTDAFSNTTLFFNGSVQIQPAARIPEPHALGLFGLGLMGLAGAVARRAARTRPQTYPRTVDRRLH